MCASSPAAQRAAKVIGIGELGASALTAGVGDFNQFKGGHQFGAWLGLVPTPGLQRRQDESGADHQARISAIADGCFNLIADAASV